MAPRPIHCTVFALLLPAVFLLVAIGSRLCYLARPFDHDSACFVYMGKMTAEGGRLGHELVDNKFPTVGLMTSAAWRVLGPSWPGYVLLGTLLSLSSAVVLARIAKPPDRLTTFCFAVVLLNFAPAVFGGFQLETVQIFFASLGAAAVVTAVREDRSSAAFVAGLCGGCAAMLKPNGLAVLAAGVIFVAVGRPKSALRLTASMAAGLAVPAAVVVLYLAGSGLLVEMPALSRQISTYASQSVVDRIEMIKLATAMSLLGFPLLVRGAVLRDRGANRRTQVKTPRQSRWAPAGGDDRLRSKSGILFPVIWLAIELTGVVAQRRMYAYHFLPLVPPAALLFGAVGGQRRSAVSSIGSQSMALALALLPFSVISVLAALQVARSPGPARSSVADYLAAHARPGDAVWSEQWPRTVLQTNLTPGSRFASTFLFANYDSAGLDYSSIILADFARTRPVFIVLPADLDREVQNQSSFIPELADRPARAASYAAGWNRIRQYTLDHYKPAATIDGSTIYHRATDPRDEKNTDPVVKT